LPGGLWASLTGFFNIDRHTSDFVSECGTVSSYGCSEIRRVDGRTYGVEVLVRRALTERLGGWIAYTLSRAERTVGGQPYLSPVDRTHVLSMVLRYDFGGGLSAGVRGTYQSGRPDFPSVSYGNGTGRIDFGPGEAPQHRLPPFYRLDLRAEKRWVLGNGVWVGLAFDFFDATLEKEAVAFQCTALVSVNAPTPVTRCTPARVGPVALPSLGVEGGF
jgi:hypothetical protein